MIAALLLVARTFLERYDLPRPTVAQILEATGAKKSRAYELMVRIQGLLKGVVGPVGRPPKGAPASPPDETSSLTRAVLAFLLRHPGAAAVGVYADRFRQKILELREAHAALELPTFADAVGVPQGTIEGWLRTGPSPEPDPAPPPRVEDDAGASARILTILNAWRSWHGPFAAFCEHVREHLRIDYGRTLIARILDVYGERRPNRRSGRKPDERATQSSFEVYFPGAQWVGDGMQVPVLVNGVRYTFNLELDVDACSGAIVGASIRDEEDSEAVVEALEDGIRTTGAAPEALLVDNRPSNHTDTVDAALGKTLGIRSTPARGQSKAHVEGAFGLFSQETPPLEVHGPNQKELARDILRLEVQRWARGVNHRPRRDRNGKSRVEIYRQAAPTDEERAEARRELEALRTKQEKAVATKIARADPAVTKLLDDAFERLGLPDPKGHIRASIAAFSLDAVVDGLAVFEGKRTAGKLPDDAGGRYLLGIVRNIAHTHESDAITTMLIKERLDMRDRLLADLDIQRSTLEAKHVCLRSLIHDEIDQAMSAGRKFDCVYWITDVGRRIADQPVSTQEELFRSAARRIHATFAAPRAHRERTARLLAREVWPLT